MRENEHDLPRDLQELGERLRREAPRPTAPELDRIKLRAMRKAQTGPVGRRGFFMRSRLATVLTIGLIGAGVGGTLTIAAVNDPDPGGNAAVAQYHPNTVRASISRTRWHRGRGGRRFLRVTIKARETVSVHACFTRKGKTLVCRDVAHLKSGTRSFSIRIPSAVSGGKALLTVTFTDRAGLTKTVHRTLVIPNKPHHHKTH